MPSKTFEAMFDGEVLRPDEPLNLPPNSRVRLTMESQTQGNGESYVFLKAFEAMKLDLSPDASERMDDYLNGDRQDDE